MVSEPVEAVGKDAKLHFLDSGLLGALLGVTAERVVKDRSIFGPLLETFIFSEELKQASYVWQELRFMPLLGRRSGRG